MDRTSPCKASDRDLPYVWDQKSKTILDLETMVSRLSNALVSLEEENLKLHKKLNGGRALSGHSYATTRDGLRRGETSPYLDKPEKDNLEATDTKLGENQSKDFKDKLHGDHKDVRNLADWKNKQPVQKSEASEASGGTLEKQWLRKKVILMQGEVIHLKESCQEARQAQNSVPEPPIEDKAALDMEVTGQLEQENKSLREMLDQSCLMVGKVQRRAESLQEQQVELERCLLTLQTEKNLLQDEVRNLHQQYLGLSKTVGLSLGDGVQPWNFRQHQREETGRDALALGCEIAGWSTRHRLLQKEEPRIGEQTDEKTTTTTAGI